MIYAIIENDGKERICCVDKAGRRAFLIETFFQKDLTELCIDSNRIKQIPETMDEFVNNYNALWADDMALFYGGNADLGISLDAENDWYPLKKTEEIWSPLETTRGRFLLK